MEYLRSVVEIAWHGAVLRIEPGPVEPGPVEAGPVEPGTSGAAVPVRFAVVTACNPDSARRPEAENRRATAALRDRLLRQGLPFVAAVGYSPDLTWVEPGFALVDAAGPDVRALCADFGQAAYFDLAPGRLQVVDRHGRSRGGSRPRVSAVPPGRSVLATPAGSPAGGG